MPKAVSGEQKAEGTKHKAADSGVVMAAAHALSRCNTDLVSTESHSYTLQSRVKRCGAHTVRDSVWVRYHEPPAKELKNE